MQVFYWLSKPEYTEKTTDLSKVIYKLDQRKALISGLTCFFSWDQQVGYSYTFFLHKAENFKHDIDLASKILWSQTSQQE